MAIHMLRDNGVPDASMLTELEELYVEMVHSRVYATRLFNLQRQGRIGTYAPIDGEEAVAVGVAGALDPLTDWLVPQYREYVAIRRFGDEILDRLVLYLRGHPEGGFFPPPIRVTPAQISLAAQIPQAVGMAWGLRLRGEPGVVACFFGDGSSSEGDFYEAANFAGVIKAPVILVCVNNGWAISTPRARQTASVTIAAKAAAFGMPGVQVDGNDVLAVRDAVREARARAVAGEGPTLLECVTYRLGPHTTADDPTRYVPPADRAAALEREPLRRARRLLEDGSRWNDARQAATEAEANERLDRAIERAETTALAPDAFFDHLYATPTARMQRQREELHQWLASRED